MRHTLTLMLLFFTLSSTLGFQGPQGSGSKEYLKNLPFQMSPIPEPSFPDRKFNIAEYGGVADGRTLNTEAFAKAIGECTKAGGGTVIVPAGTWLTGPIRMADNVNLHLERGAVIQLSSRIEDFPVVAGLEGKSKNFEYLPPISGSKLNNIAITGDGIIDGAGEAWRPVKKEKLTSHQWKDLTASGGWVSPDGKMWWPSKDAMDGEAYIKQLKDSKAEISADAVRKTREFLRPDLIRFEKCRGILLDGPTFENSPKFHVHPVQCEEIIVRNVAIRSEWYAQNGDGIDLSSCRNVLVCRSVIDCGDDGICIKPGNISESQTAGPACDHIVIADCMVYHAHGGFVVGSETFGGAANISVTNCTFVGTDVGLRFKSLRGKGGIVENIFIDGIQMKNIANEAILLDMYYGGDSPDIESAKGQGDAKSEPVNERTPQFKNISIKNVVCNGANRALRINGLPEMPIKSIRLENDSFTSRFGVLCAEADGIGLSNCVVNVSEGPVIALSQSRNMDFMKIGYRKGAAIFLSVTGDQSQAIRLSSINLQLANKGIDIGGGANEHAVTVVE